MKRILNFKKRHKGGTNVRISKGYNNGYSAAFNQFKKLSRDINAIKKIEIKFLQMETTISEIKITKNEISEILDIAKEKTERLKD